MNNLYNKRCKTIINNLINGNWGTFNELWSELNKADPYNKHVTSFQNVKNKCQGMELVAN